MSWLTTSSRLCAMLSSACFVTSYAEDPSSPWVLLPATFFALFALMPGPR